MIDKLKRNIIIAIIFSAAVYVIMSLYTEYDNIILSLEHINLLYIPIILLLSFLTFFFRFLKWHKYIYYLKHPIPFKNSLIIYFSTLTMSVTPGKVGELIKCYMMKKDYQTPISVTTSIVFAERITEMIALILMAMIGALVFEIYIEVVIGIILVFILLIYLLTHNEFCMKLIEIITRIRIFEKYRSGLVNTYNSLKELLELRIFLKMIFLSIISWIFECIAFYLIIINFSSDSTIILATFIFTFSIIVGSLSMIPGGIGIAEGSLTFLLTNFGFSVSASIAATLTLRLATLWFSVLIGLVFLSIYQSKYGKVSVES